MAISGDSIVVGAHEDDDAGSNSGSAYVFTRSGTTWSQQAKLTANDAAEDDQFGFSVAISGDTVVVGVRLDDDAEADAGSLYVFRIAEEMAVNLVVFDTVNMELLNGDSATPLNVQLLGTTSQNYTFRLLNTGQNSLDLQTISLGGTNASEFTLTHSSISSTSDIPQNGSFNNLTVTFSPSGTTSGTRNATIDIVSNDSSNTLFSFNISGLGLSDQKDEDGDGLNDWAEFSLSSLGYNWQVSQQNLVNYLFNNAATAGLFNRSEVAAINSTANLSDLDLTNNTAVFTIELQESLDLQNFEHMAIDADDLSVDGDGNILLGIDAPAGKKFYRAGFQP